MTHIEHIGSLVEQFGDDMDKAAWQQIAAKLAEGQKPSTNTQMPSASQIAAEMDMASTKIHGVVIIDLMMWNASLRQLRHL
jgi:hypothetical protein